MILIPGFRLGRGQNDRGHWRVKHKQAKAEKETTAWMLAQFNSRKPALPCVVTLTRLAPSSGLDDDNLAGALKSVRDAVAAWLGVDDRDRATVRYLYEQQRAPWGVRIEWRPM